MTKTVQWLPLTMVAVLGMISLAAWANNQAESKMTIEQVPELAREALLKQAGGAKITEVERGTEDGLPVFEAKWVANDVTYEAEVTVEGLLVATEEVVPLAKAPHKVRSVVRKRFGPDPDVVIEKKMIVVYEIEGKVDGQARELRVFPTGRVQEEIPGQPEADNDKDDDEVHHEHAHPEGH